MSDALNYDALHAGALLAPPLTRSASRPARAKYSPTVSVVGYQAGTILTLSGTRSGVVLNGGVIQGYIGALGDVLYVAPPAPKAKGTLVARLEKVQRDLERLQDGWNGVGSKAPSPSTLNEFYLFAGALPAALRAPEVEADDETGHVTVRWTSRTVAVSFILRGDGSALMVRTLVGQPTVVTSKAFDLRQDLHGVARFLASDAILADALEPA
jgi:hypothetical protein